MLFSHRVICGARPGYCCFPLDTQVRIHKAFCVRRSRDENAGNFSARQLFLKQAETALQRLFLGSKLFKFGQEFGQPFA